MSSKNKNRLKYNKNKNHYNELLTKLLGIGDIAAKHRFDNEKAAEIVWEIIDDNLSKKHESAVVEMATMGVSYQKALHVAGFCMVDIGYATDLLENLIRDDVNAVRTPTIDEGIDIVQEAFCREKLSKHAMISNQGDANAADNPNMVQGAPEQPQAVHGGVLLPMWRETLVFMIRKNGMDAASAIGLLQGLNGKIHLEEVKTYVEKVFNVARRDTTVTHHIIKPVPYKTWVPRERARILYIYMRLVEYCNQIINDSNGKVVPEVVYQYMGKTDEMDALCDTYRDRIGNAQNLDDIDIPHLLDPRVETYLQQFYSKKMEVLQCMNDRKWRIELGRWFDIIDGLVEQESTSRKRKASSTQANEVPFEVIREKSESENAKSQFSVVEQYRKNMREIPAASLKASNTRRRNEDKRADFSVEESDKGLSSEEDSMKEGEGTGNGGSHGDGSSNEEDSTKEGEGTENGGSRGDGSSNEEDSMKEGEGTENGGSRGDGSSSAEVSVKEGEGTENGGSRGDGSSSAEDQDMEGSSGKSQGSSSEGQDDITEHSEESTSTSGDDEEELRTKRRCMDVVWVDDICITGCSLRDGIEGIVKEEVKKRLISAQVKGLIQYIQLSCLSQTAAAVDKNRRDELGSSIEMYDTGLKKQVDLAIGASWEESKRETLLNHILSRSPGDSSIQKALGVMSTLLWDDYEHSIIVSNSEQPVRKQNPKIQDTRENWKNLFDKNDVIFKPFFNRMQTAVIEFGKILLDNPTIENMSQDHETTEWKDIYLQHINQMVLENDVQRMRKIADCLSALRMYIDLMVDYEDVQNTDGVNALLDAVKMAQDDIKSGKGFTKAFLRMKELLTGKQIIPTMNNGIGLDTDAYSVVKDLNEWFGKRATLLKAAAKDWEPVSSLKAAKNNNKPVSSRTRITFTIARQQAEREERNACEIETSKFLGIETIKGFINNYLGGEKEVSKTAATINGRYFSKYDTDLIREVRVIFWKAQQLISENKGKQSLLAPIIHGYFESKGSRPQKSMGVPSLHEIKDALKETKDTISKLSGEQSKDADYDAKMKELNVKIDNLENMVKMKEEDETLYKVFNMTKIHLEFVKGLYEEYVVYKRLHMSMHQMEHGEGIFKIRMITEEYNAKIGSKDSDAKRAKVGGSRKRSLKENGGSNSRGNAHGESSLKLEFKDDEDRLHWYIREMEIRKSIYESTQVNSMNFSARDLQNLECARELMRLNIKAGCMKEIIPGLLETGVFHPQSQKGVSTVDIPGKTKMRMNMAIRFGEFLAKLYKDLREYREQGSIQSRT